jgi:asparagine synthase (glutamine-hydrolysing)
MNGTMRHRGPDDAGVHVDIGERMAVGLGHSRLSIIDLSAAGHQPMTNEDGTLWLTYNGEIYNHSDLRQELVARGHRYRSQTDSETILHAYEEWGDRCVDRFRGMFAFAIWDRRHNRVLLARDRLGVKPLYYAIIGRALVFASEIKAVLASGCVAAAPAAEAVPEYLTFGYLAGEQSMFEHIRKLPPGHLLVWQDGVGTTTRYWDVDFDPDESTPEEELRRQFRELFEHSVKLRLMSDVPLGVFLSGGLDSSAIAAVMSRHVSGRLKTFSVGFERAYYSELPFAREVAQSIGADHHEVILTPSAFLESLATTIWHEDEPTWGPASVALYHVSRLAAESVKVVLTGEGSDELFGGYDRYWMTALNTRLGSVYRRLPAAATGAIRRAVMNGVLPERVRRALSHTVINHGHDPNQLVFDNWFAVFTPGMQHAIGTAWLTSQLAAVDVYRTHRELFDRSGGDDVVNRMLYTDVKSNLVELLMKQDQMSMAASIESRVPFLDHHVVEFAARVPSRFKIKGHSGKHLVKEALRDCIPERIRNRRKQGFPVPFDTWLVDHYFDRVQGLLLAPAADRGWFRPDAVRRMLAAHRERRENAGRQIWNMVTLELWARIFLDGDHAWVSHPRQAWDSLEPAPLRMAV